MPDTEGTHDHISESLKPKDLAVRDLLYCFISVFFFFLIFDSVGNILIIRKELKTLHSSPTCQRICLTSFTC